MIKQEKIIYLAGILDGEGCLIPNKSMGEYRKSKGARCEVSNTSKELIDWLYDNFGGYRCPVKREGHRKLQYRWVLRYGEIKDILPKVIPYLIIKKKEAEESLEIAMKSKVL